MKCSAQDILEHCRRIAEFTESSPGITRTFLCPAMHQVHKYLDTWMRSLDMEVSVDAAGNLHGVRRGTLREANPRLLIGSHLDTVPNAGPYDGVLGVVLGMALVQSLCGRDLPFDIEVIGFSEEEGVRFGIPFLGSRALVGRFDESLLKTLDKDGNSVSDVIRQFGLDPKQLNSITTPPALGYLEFHIEQGPVLESLGEPLGVVEAIAGQSRFNVTFEGVTNHAGTTPMHLRRDALAGAAEWIREVESLARSSQSLVATVGTIHSEPPAGNVIPSLVTASLDVRHPEDSARTSAANEILDKAAQIAARRNLKFTSKLLLDQRAVKMNPALVSAVRRSLQEIGLDAPLITSGAGHDAMIVAEKVTSVMIFLRSPRGVSHHPDETILPGDVELALSAGLRFVTDLATQ